MGFSALNKIKNIVAQYFVISLVLIVVLGCSFVSSATSTPDPEVESLVETILTETATVVQGITPEVNLEDPHWVEQIIDLYGFLVELPDGWTIQEVNRRPEPSDDPMAPQVGHDCAEYIISNSEGTEKLYLYPVCGYTDGAGEDCPADTVLLATRGETGVIVRYYDSSQSRYIFSEARFATLISSEGESKRMLCFRPAVMVYEKEESTTFVNVEYENLGSDADIEAALEIVDRIVISVEMP